MGVGATLRTHITTNRRGTWPANRAQYWKLGWESSVRVDGVANGSTRSRVGPWRPGGVATKVERKVSQEHWGETQLIFQPPLVSLSVTPSLSRSLGQRQAWGCPHTFPGVAGWV